MSINQPVRNFASHELEGSRGLAAGALAVVYIGVIALTASGTGAFYILFPELGALSYDILKRPRGRWASAPVLLVITPMLTGLIGTIVTRTLPYGFTSVLTTVTASIMVIMILRSPVAPAISAGLLPLVLGVKSSWYPPGIVFGCVVLALISAWWKRYTLSVIDQPEMRTGDRDESETAGESSAVHTLAGVLIFTAIAVAAVKLTNLRFILFPPLVVIVFEMLRDPARCPWARTHQQLIRLPIVCGLSATGGLLFHNAIPITPLAAMASMAWGIGVLRLSRLHVPPALAVALLPMVMDHPQAIYPAAVAIGATLAAMWFALFELCVGGRRVQPALNASGSGANSEPGRATTQAPTA